MEPLPRFYLHRARAPAVTQVAPGPSLKRAQCTSTPQRSALFGWGLRVSRSRECHPSLAAAPMSPAWAVAVGATPA